MTPARVTSNTISYFDEETKRSLLSESLLMELNGYCPARAFERIFEEPLSSARIDRLMYLDSKTNLPGDILVKVDRMSMANSIETRAPLLDHHLIEFAQTIPGLIKTTPSGEPMGNEIHSEARRRRPYPE